MALELISAGADPLLKNQWGEAPGDYEALGAIKIDHK